MTPLPVGSMAAVRYVSWPFLFSECFVRILGAPFDGVRRVRLANGAQALVQTCRLVECGEA